MIRTVQNNFVNGEIAPELHARHDLKAYFQGAAALHNFIPLRTGGVAKRPGTSLALAGLDQYARAIPFIIDADHAVVVILSTDYAAEDANHNYGVKATFLLCDTDTLDTDTQGTVWSVALYTTSNNVHTGILHTHLPNIRATQAGDTLFLTAPGLTPVRLVRAADAHFYKYAEQRTAAPATAVTFVGYAVTNAISQAADTYEDIQISYALFQERDGITSLRASGTANAVSPWPPGGKITVTFRLTAYDPASRWIVCKSWGSGWGIIGDFTQTTAWTTGQTYEDRSFADENIRPEQQIPYQTLIRTAAEDAYGYALLGHHQQRTVLAGNPAAPFRLWFSHLADLYGWYSDRPAADDDPFSASIPAVRASGILHLVPGRRLVLLTEDGAYTCHSEGEGFSARTCRIERAATPPASAVPPVQGDGSIIYLASDNRRLIEMRYDFAQDGFTCADRSVLAGHITETYQIVSMAFQEFPHAVLWCALADGTLASFTYMPEHEVFAWARHTVNAPWPTKDNAPARVTHVLATGSRRLPIGSSYDFTGFASPTSDIYLIVKTDHLEFPYTQTVLARLNMQTCSDSADEVKEYQPCGDLIYSTTYLPAAGAQSITLRAGAYYRLTVGGALAGEWTLATSAPVAFTPDPVDGTVLETCYPVTATLSTLRPELPDRNIQAMRKTVLDTVLRVRRCGPLTVARTGAPSSVWTMPAPAAGTLTTGDLKTIPYGLWDQDGQLTVTAPGLLPAQILSVIQTLELESHQ